MRLASYGSAHHAGKSVAIQNKGTQLFRYRTLKCWYWFGIEQEILTWFKFTPVVVSEYSKSFFISEFTDSARPLACSPRSLLQFSRVHDAPDILQKMLSEFRARTDPFAGLYPAAL